MNWETFLTPRDRAVYEAGGYGARAGYGKRPAVIIIDVNYNFCGSEPEPILESIKRWRNSCGAEAWDAIAKIRDLLEVARAKGIPVIYSTAQDGSDNVRDLAGEFRKNRRGTESRPTGGNDIVREIAPLLGELVIRKRHPSVFFDGPLLARLREWEIDSLIITGTTTSGCVRASVVDAYSNGYRVSLVEDCTFDRGQASHYMSLFEINSKYGDVVSLPDVTGYLNSLEHAVSTTDGPETQ